MAVTITHAKVSAVPDGADTSAVRPSDWNAEHTLTGLGTMAEQAASAVAVTGGTIDGTVIGGTTKAAGSFLSLYANSIYGDGGTFPIYSGDEAAYIVMTGGNGVTGNGGWVAGYGRQYATTSSRGGVLIQSATVDSAGGAIAASNLRVFSADAVGSDTFGNYASTVRATYAGTTKLCVDANGVAVAGLTVTNGAVKFPATQVASADVNTLDDYEEGTFTPVMEGTTTAGTGTYGFRYGYYTKIGNVVVFHLTVYTTAHTGTGNIRISGMPFASSVASSSFTVMPSALTYTGTISGEMPGSVSYFDLVNAPSNVASSAVAMDATTFIRVTGTYFTPT